MLNKDTMIFALVYLVALAIMLYYNLTHLPVNDGVKEYETYLLNIRETWAYRRTLVNSSLITTWVPAMLQQWTGWSSMTVFRIFPPVFYALMPAFTYLIARRYMVARYALVASLVVLTNSHILFFPDIGRVGVGIALFAGMIWALLDRRLVWAMVFAILVVFAHYGTSLIAMGLTLACTAGYLVWRKKILWQYLVVSCVLVSTIWVWHFWISSYSGWVMFTYGIQQDMPWLTGDIVGPAHGLGIDAWLDIYKREPAVVAALGLNENTNAPEAIEIMANWIVVGLTTLGLWLLLISKRVEIIFKVMGLSLWTLIIFTVAVPWLSLFYGGMRVYFTTVPVLATCFVMGGVKVAKWAHIHPLILCGIILVLFAISTSGVIYLPFGLLKTFPVYFSLGAQGGLP